MITALREYFCVYGTPEEIASDGAPVYTSAATRAFLEMWGVRQRISTA